MKPSIRSLGFYQGCPKTLEDIQVAIMEVYLPLIAGFVGALIGALASIVAITIQSRAHERRDKMRLMTELALEDYKIHHEAVKSAGGAMPPLVVYLHYHQELMDLIEKKEVTPAALQKLRQVNDEIIRIIEKRSSEREK